MLAQTLIDLLASAYDGAHAKKQVGEIIRYHRIQASPDFRAAAHWLAGQLQAAGIEATVESYPANHNTHFGVLPSFPEWHCRAATLDWLREEGSERLCDYRLSPVHVIQRSQAVSGEFAVVDVGAGGAEDYRGVDVEGKLVLSRASLTETYERAVVQGGAAGILVDDIGATAPGRNPIDLPDARQYTSFWWQAGQTPAWGFVLSPRQGWQIRQALQSGQSVTLRAYIDAESYDGAIEVVSAILPGYSEQAVLATAHLCHPHGFANDNASGAACLLELATTLQRLLAAGDLPPLRHSIRFLWVPEMTGTYAWLDRHRDLVPHIIAGINLDMVGQKQESTGSVWVLEEPPAAAASFVPDLLEALRDLLLKRMAAHDRYSRFPRLRYTRTPFSGGSDHMVTSDPAVGIPTPMLIQWPDRFYHTTADTMEHVDAQSLWLSGVLAGSYLLWLATAQGEEMRWLGWDMLARYEARLGRLLQDGVSEVLSETDAGARKHAAARLADRLRFAYDRCQAAMASLPHGQDAPWQTALQTSFRTLQGRLAQQLAAHGIQPEAPPLEAWQEQARQRVPVRHYWGPLMDFVPSQPNWQLSAEDLATWRELAQDVPHWRVLRAQAEYWVDGRRSLAEIAHLLELETGQAVGPSLERYFDILARVGLLSWQDSASIGSEIS